jgi:Ca2+-transporting ATPase
MIATETVPDMRSSEAPWRAPVADLLAQLGTDPELGLSQAEAQRRLLLYGRNRLRTRRPRPAWRILLNQFASLLVALLLIGAALAFLLQEWVQGGAILVVVLLNAAIGFAMELRAARSMEALRALGGARATVRRNGTARQISAEILVPGDVVLIEGGDVVTADLRLLEASKLQADESALTGESLPVAKRAGSLEGEPPLAERWNMLYKGTAVTRGAGAGLVVATGMATELGGITSLVIETDDEETPLERRLGVLGRRLVWVTLVIAGMIAVTGVLQGLDPFLITETAIALAVAAVPEGLPIIATIALARGMHRMAQRHALVNRLSAVETLGATTIILTDKTGTLTENRLAVARIVTGEGELEPGSLTRPEGLARELIETGVLCNDATLGEAGPVGDPIDAALLGFGAERGVRRVDLLARWPETLEEAFDPDLRLMGTVHQMDGEVRVAVKGATEAVLGIAVAEATPSGDRPLDDGARKRWRDLDDALAAEGLRVLALASRRGGPPDQPYRDLTILGLVGIADPPRPEVAEALAACRRAGIRVVMVTGDHPATALTIAKQVGLLPPEARHPPVLGNLIRPPGESTPEERDHLCRAAIVARMSPAQKLELISLHQSRGEIVAMTGDGVNDAPALARADVGIAMGQRGTEVAREAADIVLGDDAFSTIVEAIRQGRVIFGNLRTFIYYLLSCNLSEIGVIAVAQVVGAPLPLLPLQILFLNLVTDVFPALALGLGEGDPAIMTRPPRGGRAPLLAPRHWWSIVGYGALLTVAVLGAQQMALHVLRLGPEGATSIAFLTLALAQLWHVFNMRAVGSRLVRNAVVQNPWVWAALALCIPLVLATVYLPGLARVLNLGEPGREGWVLILGFSLVPFLLGQLGKALLPLRRHGTHGTARDRHGHGRGAKGQGAIR